MNFIRRNFALVEEEFYLRAHTITIDMRLLHLPRDGTSSGVVVMRVPTERVCLAQSGEVLAVQVWEYKVRCSSHRLGILRFS